VLLTYIHVFYLHRINLSNFPILNTFVYFKIEIYCCKTLNISGLAFMVAYPCSYERPAWVRSLSSPTHEACLLSVDEMKLSPFLKSFVAMQTIQCQQILCYTKSSATAIVLTFTVCTRKHTRTHMREREHIHTSKLARQQRFRKEDVQTPHLWFRTGGGEEQENVCKSQCRKR
jgi:hypothetical protein